ncbi:MAG TPA: ATP-dependent helicase [Candidatus Latescibacteria bacterium]|nr:ATP-dependent helicase [Candidatus Latescibacterota bacterium]HPK75498.1 ATP-dependent helicase [Candidatus Latescibacterota bacterium]
MDLDPSQLRFCESEAPRLRLLAPAGSGKTLSLLWRCKFLHEKGRDRNQRFLLFTFTRAARDELLHRVHTDDTFAAIRESVRIDTVNRWGYNYLRKQVNASLALKSEKKDMYALVKHVLRPVWSKQPAIAKVISKSPNRYADVMRLIDALKTAGFRHDAPDLMSAFANHLVWLQGCGLTRYVEANIEKELDSLGFAPSQGNSQLKMFSRFLRFWKEVCEHLWASAIITMDDQKYWTLITLQQKYANSAFPEPNRYHHIMVDEFQDINPLDLFLVQELVRVNRSTLTIVGDDDQAVFEWRGAVPKFILQPQRYFGEAFETHTLGINYRSPANLLYLSQRLIARNLNRVPKNVRAMRSENAEIRHESFPNHDAAIAYVAELAREAAQSGHTRALAVLSRKKSQLIPIQILLTSEGIPYYAKEDLNVLLSEAFAELRTILEAVATFRERRSANDVVKTFLRCCDKVRTYPIPSVCSRSLYGFLMSRTPRTLADCLSEFLKYPGNLRLSGHTEAIEYGYPIAKVMGAKTVTEAIELIECEMAGLAKHYSKGEEDIFYKDPPFLHLADFAQRYGSDFFRFIDDVDAAIASMASATDGNQEDEAGDDDLQRPVHLMTALRAKGKEFRTVAILDANDGMWPIRYAETTEELEQERRVFYVAVTRAERRLLLLSVRELVGKTVEITPFLREMGLTER